MIWKWVFNEALDHGMMVEVKWVEYQHPTSDIILKQSERHYQSMQYL
jgi:hypothetical protein